MKTSAFTLVAILMLLGMHGSGLGKQPPAAASQTALAAKDMEQMQGDWVCWDSIIRVAGGGPPFDRVTITGSKMMMVGLDDAIATDRAYMIELDAKKKTIDLTQVEGPGKGEVMRGIYSFRRGTVKLCLSKPGGERPQDFLEVDEDDAMFFLKRPVNEQPDRP